MLIKQQLTKLAILLFFMQIVFISGCASDKYQEGLNVSGEYRVTDRDIVEFNNHVRHMMRLKMKYSTIAAYAASTIAIGTATAATILSAGGAAGALTIASLAGASAFSTDIMGIFSFSDSTLAYQDGVALMEKAEAKYFRELARKNTDGLIEMNTLTIEAANLYTETVGALTLVEKALASRIPTMEDVRQATGRTIADTIAISEGNSGALSSISVAPNKVTLEQIEEGDANFPKKTITFKGDVPAKSVLSLDETVVTVTEKTGLDAVLTGKHAGETTVIVLASNGRPTRVNVEVSSPISIRLKTEGRSVETIRDTITQNQEIRYEIASISSISVATMKPATCTIMATDSAIKINKLADLKDKTGGEFIIKDCAVDTYTLNFENKFGTQKVLTLEVVQGKTP